MDSHQIYKFIVEESGKGERLDKYILGVFPHATSRTYLQRLIASGLVLLNGEAVKKNSEVKSGDTIEVRVPPPEPSRLTAEDIPIKIIFEDEDVIVVDKAAGMVVHPAPGNQSGTLVNALLYHSDGYKEFGGNLGGNLRPGVVHRLDKGTSGVMVVAKNEASQRQLAKQFKKHTVKRRYIAFVRGIIQLDNGIIDVAIGRDPANRQRMAPLALDGKEAKTVYKALKRFKDYTMVELSPVTGRTHQIRVHMKYLGYPLLGDTDYGRRSDKGISRHALHAAYLGFAHPATDKFLEFSSELPQDMKALERG